MKEQKWKIVCPKCGSDNVETDFSIPTQWAYGTPAGYICKKCGFAGNLFPEVEEEKTKRRKL